MYACMTQCDMIDMAGVIQVSTSVEIASCNHGSKRQTAEGQLQGGFLGKARQGGGGCRMRHVVLDEADLLLTGGYEKDTCRILQAFLEGDRQQRASAAAQRFGLTDDMLQRMPRQLRRAAKKGRRQKDAPAMY